MFVRPKGKFAVLRQSCLAGRVRQVIRRDVLQALISMGFMFTFTLFTYFYAKNRNKQERIILEVHTLDKKTLT